MSRCLTFLLICIFYQNISAKTHDCTVQENNEAATLVEIDVLNLTSTYVPDITGNLSLGVLIPLFYSLKSGQFYYLGFTDDRRVMNFGITDIRNQRNVGNFIIEGPMLDYFGYNDHINQTKIGCRSIGSKL